MKKQPKEKRNFLTLTEYTPKKMAEILSLAQKIKKTPAKYRNALERKSLAMIFHKTSTRTRVSFEVGMYQLGGQALYLGANDIQIHKPQLNQNDQFLKKGESFADTARTLSRYVDAIMLRTYSHSIVEEFAEHATIPIINGLTDTHHPCQALADLMTMQEYYGKLKGLQLVFFGDGNNVVHSLLIACALTGIHFRLVCPKNYSPDKRIFEYAYQEAKKRGARIAITHEVQGSCAGADAVYTDVWTSMGQEKEMLIRKKAFEPYRITKKLMQTCPEAIFLHCLPANRGEEVEDEVIDGKMSQVWNQAENRLHAQKAILLDLMK